MKKRDLAVKPTIIQDNRSLLSSYNSLRAGDIACGRIRMKRGEEHLLVDLLERGVNLIPSATSQLSSRSKVLQARLFEDMMIPDTTAVYDLHDLLETICRYQRHNVTKVVMKQDRKNGGLGIHLFQNAEDLYTQAAHDVIPFPFVLQPFVEKTKDVRVIIIGNYVEAYHRSNPDNFRNNLHWGGNSKSWKLNEKQHLLCSEVMRRGGFPYGHIDLMVTEDNMNYLTEINLSGGIKGAAISTPELRERKRAVENTLLEKLLQEKP